MKVELVTSTGPTPFHTGEVYPSPEYAPVSFVYTADEHKCLATLQKECEEVPDDVLWRFLRARNFDVEAAKEMLLAYLEWEDEFEAWPADKVDATDEKKCRNAYVLERTDFWGRPIIYCRPRFVKPAFRTAEVSQQVFYSLVKACQAVAAANGVEQCVVIFNLEGWGLRNRDNATMKLQIDMLQNMFPETLGRAFLVNYPWLLNPVWKIIKPWLDPNTVKKVEFVTRGKELEMLLKVAPKSALPTGVGGDLAEQEPLIDMWPEDGQGWFGGWFGKSKSGTSKEDPNDPFAGLTEDEKAAKMQEIEDAQLAEARAFEEAKAKEEEAKPKKKARRKKKKKKGQH